MDYRFVLSILAGLGGAAVGVLFASHNMHYEVQVHGETLVLGTPYLACGAVGAVIFGSVAVFGPLRPAHPSKEGAMFAAMGRAVSWACIVLTLTGGRLTFLDGPLWIIPALLGGSGLWLVWSTRFDLEIGRAYQEKPVDIDHTVIAGSTISAVAGYAAVALLIPLLGDGWVSLAALAYVTLMAWVNHLTVTQELAENSSVDSRLERIYE